MDFSCGWFSTCGSDGEIRCTRMMFSLLMEAPRVSCGCRACQRESHHFDGSCPLDVRPAGWKRPHVCTRVSCVCRAGIGKPTGIPTVPGTRYTVGIASTACVLESLTIPVLLATRYCTVQYCTPVLYCVQYPVPGILCCHLRLRTSPTTRYLSSSTKYPSTVSRQPQLRHPR